MDDLYGDLENYNEVNILDELRNENKDLKLKLEEYETAMGKLQKSLLQDYDKLAMEFNNLQKNYSSLLKTARSEVERKAQMITQLNLDKDTMVLKALQNGNNRRFPNNYRFQKDFQNSNKGGKANANKTINQNNVESNKGKVGKKAKNEPQQKNLEDKNERCEPSCVATATVTSSDTAKLINIVDNVVDKIEACISKGELKENVSHCTPEHKEIAHPSTIKDRRKSVPAAVMRKFSSDEDCGSEKSTTLTRHKEPPQEIPEIRNINAKVTKISNEQLVNRTSETSSTDGRSSNYQETDKECYKSRTSRHTDRFRDGERHTDRYKESDKFRGVDKVRDVDKLREGDKYRESGKFRENDRYRETDKQRDSGKYRESDKHRESDKYRESDRHRGSDKRRDTDKRRDSGNHKDCDKHKDSDRFRGRDKFDSSLKHRKQLPERPPKRSFREHQEDHGPEFGRRRLASASPEPQNSYNQRSHDHRLHYEARDESDKFKNHPEHRHAEKLPIHENHDVPSGSKRQKLDPDVHIDKNRRHYDREHLTRPPRNDVYEYDMLHESCQSPDAVFSPDTNAEVVHPHTVLEIKNTPTIELEDPRVTSKKYVLKDENGKTTLSASGSKTIDIKPVDKSLWNIESVAVPNALLSEPQTQFDEQNIKEIYMDIDNLETNVSVESGEIHSDSEELHSKPNKENVFKQDSQTNDIVNKPAIEATPVPKLNPDKVPMIASNYRIPKKSHKAQSQVSEVIKALPTIVCEERNVEKKDCKISESLINIESGLPQIEEHDNFVAASNTHLNLDESNKDKHQITLSQIAMVQDDLELSDEASDNLELQRQLLLEKINGLGNTTKPEFKITLDDQVNNADVINIETDDKTKASDKKHRSKRRKTKSKEKELVETGEKVHVTERKTKSKKEKVPKPKEVTNKFSDLFGDSSSLITPEDLGIPISCVPLCEDAQDAVDINFKEIVKAPLFNPDAKEKCDYKEQNNIHIESTQSTNVSNPNTEDKEIAKRIEEQIASPDVDTNIVYKNLNADEETNKPDVVKTVIISSGVQPQFVVNVMENRKIEDRVADVEVNIQNIVDCYQPPAVIEFKKLNAIKALATSTPHKDCTVTSTNETDSIGIEHVSNCNDSNSVSVDTGRQAADHSDTNTQESHDAPDVRIFVRRRRKGIKKT